MNDSNLLTPFGLKDGQLVHVDDVPRGLECGCVCPACGGPLVARKGDVKIHHFAHANGENCAAAYETALHIAAKDILKEHREIAPPLVEVKFTSYRAPIVLASARNYQLDTVVLEKRLGSVVPDVLATAGGKELMIEIKVSHAVDEDKIEKIRALKVSAIEIDLSDLDRNLSLLDVKKHVVDPSPRKSWLHNAVAQQKLNELVSAAHSVRCIDRGGPTHVDGCPLPARIWKGKPYANAIDDCLECRYAMAVEDGIRSITCAAFNPKLRELVDQFDGV